jgi:hypothetical protein
MKRVLLSVTIAAVALAGAGLASAKPGNGAQKAGIAAVRGLSPLACSAAPSTAGSQTATGFAVLNAPGKPGSPRKIVGEVALKDAEPGTYDIRLATPASTPCGASVAQLVVGANRNGNASVAAAAAGEGTYYVVITSAVLDPQVPVAAEQYASAPVTLR